MSSRPRLAALFLLVLSPLFGNSAQAQWQQVYCSSNATDYPDSLPCGGKNVARVAVGIEF